MRLFLRTAAAFNLLAAPVFGRGISSPNTAPDGSLLADDNVVRFMGGLAVGGTVGYFAGAQQHRRKMKNRQRKPLPDSDPNTPTTTEIDNEQMKTIELETKIHEYLQSDHDGLDWTYECRTLRVRTGSHKSLSPFFVSLAGGLIIRERERERSHLHFKYQAPISDKA